ncbi:MAG: hypothetical protein JWM68_5237 [Verrucomicrobiales bacterium]|nr:hypothetical protein [Verrucomicrobiales bacterium]
MSKNVGSLFALFAFLSFTACKTQHVPKPESQPVAVTTSRTNAPSNPAPIGIFPIPTKPTSTLRVPHIFSDNMVLQQDMNVPVWGWAKDNESVTVTFGANKVSTTARTGKWTVKLHSLKQGDADTLTVTAGAESIQFTNVLVGEVWLCSGQSNMEWPLSKSFEPQEDIASATNQLMRLFVVPNVKSDVPRDDVEGHWEICSSNAAARFSAVGYYFGKDLHKARKTPVGLIQSDWGGTPVESWTSHESLARIPAGKDVFEAYTEQEQNYSQAKAAYEKQLVEEERLSDKNKKKPTAPYAPHKPSELFNGMIAPIVPYGIKGAIWYQGENNAERAAQYRVLFPNMIRDWRQVWNQGDFTFCCVQLAPFKPIKPTAGDSDWAELREAQLLTTKFLPKVGMAVITDVGEERNIHPAKKAPVGGRLALAARALAYGDKIVYSGPVYKSVRFQDDKAFLKFDHVGKGLTTHGGALKSFAICDSNKKWVWAIADIEGTDTVVVSSPNVENPIAVRFGWADYPVVNLWNREGLPASPFRTDNFPMITEGKK